MSLIVDEHREYLADARRLDAFAAAIAEAVRPGAVVVDLASGTGILGFLACRAGAARVYAIEMTGLVEVSRQLAAANGLTDRVHIIHGFSREVALPERVDVIVCDQIGHFGFEAGLVEFGIDARDRFLKPGGRVIPASVDLVVAPIESEPLAAQVEFWTRPTAGLDFSAARRWAVNTGYPTTCSAQAILAPGVVGGTIEMASATTGPVAFEVTLEVERAGTMHGVAGWFKARLSPSVTLTNAPTDPGRIDRRHVFFPIERAVAVTPGDSVTIGMHIIPAQTIVSWSVAIRRDGATLARSQHSTLHGMLLTRDDVRRTDPRIVPALTPRGHARRIVLELCDGRHTLGEVEQAVWERHRDLFASPDDAATFVAEVVTRYGRSS